MEYFIISDLLGINLHLMKIDHEIFFYFHKYWLVQTLSLPVSGIHLVH